MIGKPGEPVIGHHFPGGEIGFAAPVEVAKLERKATSLRYRRQDLHPGGQNRGRCRRREYWLWYSGSKGFPVPKGQR
ncbi:hypothetical protein ACFSUK_17760 [Sphingobium scionense]